LGPVRSAAELAGNEINESGARVCQTQTVGWFQTSCCLLLAAAVNAKSFVVAGAPDKIN
jgi:hypothetical protein